MDSNNEAQTLHTSAISPIRREPYLHEPVTVIDEARGKPVPAIVHDVLPRDNFGHARVSVNAFTDSGVVVYSNLRLFNPPLAGSRPGDRVYAVRTINHDDLGCFVGTQALPPPEPGNGEFEDGFTSTHTPNDPPAPASSEATPDAPADSATAESTTTETCPAEAAAS